MLKIEKLTAKQEAQLEVYKQKWLKVGLSTERFDFKTAKEISDYYYINFLYRNPVPVVILNSPASAWLAVCMLSGKNQVRNQVSDRVSDQVWNQVNDRVRDQVSDRVRNQVSDRVRDQVRDQVWNQVWNQVRSQVSNQVGDQVRNQVRNQVWNQVSDQVGDQVSDQVSDQVWNQVWNQVRSQVRSQVSNQLRGQVSDQVKDQIRDYVHPYIDGHLYASYFSFFDFINKVLKIPYDCQEKYDWYRKTTQIGNFYPLGNICVISQKPIEINMLNGSLHAEGKPAVLYADGFAVWSLNGVRVPQYLAETPAGGLSIEFFKKEKNTDIKAEFIRKFGIDRMISMGKLIDTWENHSNTKNFEWYKKSEYKIYDMSSVYTEVNNIYYLPFLYMKNQTTGIYHLECCYDPKLKQQPKTILDGLQVRMSGLRPEETDIMFIA